MAEQEIVTDHAVLRYLERVAGLDMKRLRRGIENKTRHARLAGAISITVDGFTYRMDPAGRVVTIRSADKEHDPTEVFDQMGGKRR